MNTLTELIIASDVLLVVVQALVFLWINAKTRQGTFFGVRAEPDFPNSDNGRAILRKFRRRVWLLALLASIIFAASLWFGRPIVASRIRSVAFYLIMVGDVTAFAMASKETRVKAPPWREPLQRIAALFTEAEERSHGLAIVDWVAIPLPVLFPIVTALLFVLSWTQIPVDKRRDLVFVGIAAPLSIVSAFSYFALRFRARSRDWNPDPRASRKYRAMLGLGATSGVTFLSFVLCSLCVIDAVPLKEATQWRLLEVFLSVFFLGLPVLFFGFFGMLWWLKRNVSAESGDPMPDTCWKWGYFYFNSDDPALVVPLRSGFGLSYNHARRPVWWFFGGPMIMLLIVILLLHSSHFSFVPAPGTAIGTRRSASNTTQPGAFLEQRGGATSLTVAAMKTRVNPGDGLTYVWIPPGTFQMGCSPGDDSECDTTRYPHSGEKPRHTVTISKGFWIGQTPMTQVAYMKVIGSNPSHFKGDQLPVESVSWDDANAYCQHVEMRLPTEAEYEYAARGGSPDTRYGPPDQIAWYSANSGDTTHEVALKQPNAFGLYDMLGNVWEWVADWYAPYNGASVVDPKGPLQATPICVLKFFFCHQERVIRGGSWAIGAFFTRVSVRGMVTPEFRVYDGFRCAGN